MQKYEFIEKDVSGRKWAFHLIIALIAKTRDDTTIAVNSEWSKRISSEKKKNEEKVEFMEEKLKRKQNEIDILKVVSFADLH